MIFFFFETLNIGTLNKFNFDIHFVKHSSVDLAYNNAKLKVQYLTTF